MKIFGRQASYTSLAGIAAASLLACGSDRDPASGSAGATTTTSGSSGSGEGSVTSGSSGASSGSSGAGGSGGSEAGRVPVFVAQGELGRTTISCDDGKTWIGNRSWDLDGDPMMCGMKQSVQCGDTCSYAASPTSSCFQAQCCNDTPDVAKGIAYGDGVFVASWGWGGGGAGNVRRSTNGIDWTTTYPTSGFGDVAFGAGHFVAASPSPIWSTDGADWADGIKADYRDSMGGIVWSVRRMGFADYEGGRFVTYATPNPAELITSDGGQTWWKPTVWPDDCAAGGISSYGDILYGDGVIVIVDYAGTACRSTDGGVTWATAPTGVTTILSRGVWTGTEFRFWGQGIMISSHDGLSWTTTMLPGSPWIEGPVVRSPVTGTYVAIANLWNGYDKQSFLRSTDGIAWEPLAAGAFVPSHPIMYMTFGYTDPTSDCPLP